MMSQEQEVIAQINKVAFGVRSMDTAAEILEGLKGLGYRNHPELLTDEELLLVEEPCVKGGACPLNANDVANYTAYQLDMLCDLCLRKAIAQAQLDKKAL